MEIQQVLRDDVISVHPLSNKGPTLFIRSINESVKMDDPASVP
jgi:hypothetical protein